MNQRSQKAFYLEVKIYSNDTGYTAIGITSHHGVGDEITGDITSANFRMIDKFLFETLLEYRTSTL